jgi:predicted RND superfamily exporter protein
VSDAVHIINIYHKEGIINPRLNKKNLLALAFRKSLTPCFYTTLTTIVGYFALYLSPLPAFKNMGILTCIGLLLCFVLVYVIVIIGLSYYNIDFKSSKPVLSISVINNQRLITNLNAFTSNHKNTIIAFSFLLTAVGIYSVFELKTDTDSLNLLAEGKAKQDLRIIESNLGASSRIQINITTASEDDIFLDDGVVSLQKFQKQLDEHPLLSNPVSVITIKDFLEERTPVLFQSNINKTKLQSALTSYNEQSNSFYTFFSNDFKTVGITVGVKELKTSELESVMNDIETAFELSFNTEKFSIDIQGFSVVFSQLNKFILQTQFRSFFAAFIVGFLALLFFIKKVKTTILVLIPNVLPLLILALAMWVLEIPLDVTTAMITPIMLGIAMDDTIPLIYKYKRTKAIKGNAQQRIDKSMMYTGGALLSTTIALVAGFLIISTSAVPSVSEFGLLCALTILMAFITDVVFLPALLKRFDK